ncbi:hypothetical protein [Coleofasciculus sp. F4-SAH-05]
MTPPVLWRLAVFYGDLSFVICHLSFVICHSSFVICHSSFVIQQISG